MTTPTSSPYPARGACFRLVGRTAEAIMKCTPYFLYTRQRPDRVGIDWRWIEQAVTSPVREQVQPDGRIRRWARIAEARGKVLRVVLLEDGETVHNACFDRGFES